MNAHLWSTSFPTPESSRFEEDIVEQAIRGFAVIKSKQYRTLACVCSWFMLTSMPRIQRKAGLFAKRILDITVSTLVLIALTPIFAAVALAIKLTDFGPVLFWQERVGMHGATFRFPKFHSMVTQAEAMKLQLLAQNQHGDSVTFKMKHDSRVTRVGRSSASMSCRSCGVCSRAICRWSVRVLPCPARSNATPCETVCV